MFDANMRHIPAGREVFAKVHYIDKDNKAGLSNYEIVLCKMLDDETDDPRVEILLKETSPHEVNLVVSGNDLGDCWIVYEGNITGSGFIDNVSQKIAMSMLRKKYEDSTNIVVVGSGHVSDSVKPKLGSSGPMKKLKLQTAIVMAMVECANVEQVKFYEPAKDMRRKGKGKHRNRYGTNPAYPS